MVIPPTAVLRPGYMDLECRGDPAFPTLGKAGPSRALDLAHEFEGRSEGLGTLFPLRGADLARMRGHVLCGLDLAQQISRIAADALGSGFHGLDDPLRIHDEGRTVGQALAGTQHLK